MAQITQICILICAICVICGYLIFLREKSKSYKSSNSVYASNRKSIHGFPDSYENFPKGKFSLCFFCTSCAAL